MRKTQFFILSEHCIDSYFKKKRKRFVNTKLFGLITSSKNFSFIFMLIKKTITKTVKNEKNAIFHTF